MNMTLLESHENRRPRTLILLATICVVLLAPRGRALPIVTSVVETGGDGPPTAKFTGETFDHPNLGTGFTVPVFDEEAPAFTDRAHQWNGADPAVPLPAYLVGGEYIMIRNDNRENTGFQLDVTLSQRALVYVLVDNRLSDGFNTDPPDFTTSMTWLLTSGWAPVATGWNRISDPFYPDEVGVDEGGDGFGPGMGINQWSSIYVKELPAGAFSLFQADNPSRNMYGVVVTPVPAEQPPKIVNLSPADRTHFQSAASAITFNVTTVTPNQVPTAEIRLVLNGADVTSRLAMAGSATDRQVTWPGPLTANTFYTGLITAKDNAGRTTTKAWSFDTVNPTTALVIEAEDYNYANAQCNFDGTVPVPPVTGGLLLDNPAPVNADFPTPDSYANRVGMLGVDYGDQAATAGSLQNNVYRLCDLVGTQRGTDFLRQKFADTGTTDYQVHQVAAGEWLNYTRTFAAGPYEVYLRLNGTGTPKLRLDLVTGDRTRANPSSFLLGFFEAASGLGYRYVRLTDLGGQPLVLGLTGVQTVRLTALEATSSLNLNYLLFVPSTDPASLLGPVVASTVPIPGTVNAPSARPIEVNIVNRTTAVDPASILLELDGANVTGASSVTPGPTGVTVRYQPPVPFPLASSHTAKVSFRDTAGNPVTTEWSFTVTTDEELPTLVGTRPVLDPGTKILTLVVTFSEPMDPRSLLERTHYTANKGLTFTAAGPGPDSSSVVLTGTGATSGRSYVLTVNEVRDAAGNAIASNSTIRFNPSPFEQDTQGFLVVEAESFFLNTPGTGSSPEIWTFVTDKAGYSGRGAMQTLPDNSGTSPSPDQLAQSPRLDYPVKFVRTGTHYIWIRGSAGTGGPTGTSGNSDSLHFGMDQQHLMAVAGLNNPNFVWSRTVQSSLGNNFLEVFAPGETTLQLWMREDGTYADKILLTTDPAYVPSGLGPVESRRVGDPFAPNIQIGSPTDGQIFGLGEPITLTATVTDPDSTSAHVEFFVDGNPVGEDTSAPYSSPPLNLAVGRYTLTARATDDDLMTRLSPPVLIQVGQPTPQVLLVVGDPNNLGPGDAGVQQRLESFGFEVVVVDDAASTTQDAVLKALILTSATVSSGSVTTKFRDVPVPVLNWEQALQDDYLLTGDTVDVERGETPDPGDQTDISLVQPSHPLAAGLIAGRRPVVSSPQRFTWGVPAASAAIVATLADNPTRATIYAYDTGALLIDGLTKAPARRVHFLLQENTFAGLNQDGLRLFDAAASFAMNRPLKPEPKPVTMQNARVSAGSLSFSFNTVTGGTYRVQYRDALGSGAWLDLQTEVGTGAAATVTHALAAGMTRFYRVISE
ncbi:MAG: hypothetical protein FJ387_00980 [Verrucomicrobia bacterium]|nr:hypothetical protein [Verrucomicrobiota bacterium]